MENLQNKKIEIIEHIGDDGLRKLKFSKILKLLENEIQELMNYWTIKQIHKMLNEVFELNVSAPLFYKFCSDLKKDEKLESVKIGKIKNLNISQNKDIKKEQKKLTSILDEDELNVIAMYSNPKKD